jgi:PAS domain S-box-containing protein
MLLEESNRPIDGLVVAPRSRSGRSLRLFFRSRHTERGSSRLGKSLGLAGIPLVLLILGGAMGIIADRRATAYAAGQREAASFSVALAEQTARTIQGAFLDLSNIVETIEVEKIVSSPDLATAMGTQSAHEWLRAGISGLSQVEVIAVVGADGRLLGSSQYWPTPIIDLSNREFFNVMKDDPTLDRYLSPPIVSRTRGTWTVFVVRRIKAPDGTFIGVVAGSVELSYFADFYRTVAEGSGLEVSLWRSNGMLLARYPDGDHGIGASLYNRDIFGPDDAAAESAKFLAMGQSVPKMRPAATKAVGDLPLFVTVSRTESSIAQEWQAQAVAVGAGAILSSSLLVLAIISLARQITRREATEKMLRQHRDNLERDVAQRTKALAASEARHRDVAEIAGDWLWEIDAARRFTFASQRFSEATGIAAENFIGKAIHELPGFAIGAADSARVFAAMRAYEPFTNLTSRVEFTDGHVRFWRTSGKPFFDPETDTFAGYRGSGSDVTDVVESDLKLNAAVRRAEAAEEEARRVRIKLLDAIEVLPAGFALWDAEDRLELCNARYREIYHRSAAILNPGVDFEDVLRTGAAIGEFTLPPDVDIDKWAAERIALHRSARSFFEHRLADGRWIQVDERRTADGSIVGTRVDTTEAHKREAIEGEREKLAALGHLAGGVAHEINNLLQPAIIFPELIAERLPENDTESREDLACVLESARKARDIVKNILRFARKEELVLESLDIVAEARAALTFVRNLLPATISLADSVADLPLLRNIAANKTQLTQVMTNLIVNAAHAMKDHGTITVSVKAWTPTAEATPLDIEPHRPYVALAIADDGCGMDAETQARIFEPFFTTKPVGQGTGLGLSVAYGILRSWGGAIGVTSAPGKGATFTLYIPIIIPAIDAAS